MDNPERFLSQQQPPTQPGGGVDLPQFAQQTTSQPDMTSILETLTNGDETSQRRLGLLKQFISRKAHGATLQNLLNGLRG